MTPAAPNEEDLFHRALALPAHERSSFLDLACTGDRAVRAGVESLLRLHAQSDSFLREPAPEAAATIALHAGPADEKAGDWIGRYKLLEKIGEGGFGTVYMAAQEEPVRRRVALKVIKLGMDTQEVVARFEAERQALALMEHPNIARVIDAGATDTGRPYFVMELVRGVAITRYCDENKLSATARLRLFVTVCQAVQHAHQKGVIHRDLKPSNILVTLHDGVPVPKIIDFGIAKATSARLTDQTLVTRFHAFIGTPAYTSPEQMEMSGLDIDTRSDIYSLGVLLYELLTGQPPFDAAALVKSGLEAMRRTVREIDPPRPSARLNTLTDENRTSVALQRSTDAGKLSLLLRGDLDWIAMRCLEKDRTRRYDSATSLAADIERHLADAPVEARPPSRLYQARKFVRRNKLAVGAASAVTLSLVAGLIASSTLLVSERSARRLAVAAQNRAVSAEGKERELHHQADLARDAEVKRSARTALDLAHRTLADGRMADGLAYLVYAARKNPGNPALGPRLASVLASHNFMLPRAAPLRCDSRVLALRFSRDGRSFLVGTQNGTLLVVDAATGSIRQQFQFGHEVVANGWEFARLNENVVGARSPDNVFTVFDLATGVRKIPSLRLDPSVGLPDSWQVAGISPNGRWIYATARQEFWLWDADTGALRLNRKLDDVLGGVDFNPAEDILAIPFGDFVHRWTLPTGELIGDPIRFRPPNLPRYGYQARFSPDGRLLAVTNFRGLQVFDAVTGEVRHSPPPELGANFTLAASYNQNATAWITNDRLVVEGKGQYGAWDLRENRFSASRIDQALQIAHDVGTPRMAAISRDGLVRVFDFGGSTTPVAEPAWRQSAAHCAVLSPDGTQLLLGTSEGLVHRFALGDRAARPFVVARPRPSTSAFLPTPPVRLLMLLGDRAKVLDVAAGREVAGGFPFPVGERPAFLAPRADLKFALLRFESGVWQSWELGPEGVRRVITLQDAPTASANPTLGPTQDVVSLGNPHSQARVWNLRTGLPVGPSFSDNYSGLLNPFSASFSADGKRLAIGAHDGAALVFDVTTGRPVQSLEPRRHVRTAAVQFSPDGERIVTLNFEGESRLWNAATGRQIGPALRVVTPVDRMAVNPSAPPVFSSDSRWVALHDSTSVSVLDGRTGVVTQRILPGGLAVRFSPDGHRLAIGGSDGTTRVWDVRSGDAVTEALQNPPGVNGSDFSPDGRFLKTENTSRLAFWAVPPPLPEGTTTPEWLLELATLCAGQVVDDTGQLVPPRETDANIERVRRQIAALPVDAPLADWGRWLLDERADRPIAPGFTIGLAEAAQLKAQAEASAPAR